MIRRAVCALLGHKPVFTHITLPRVFVCATCGHRFTGIMRVDDPVKR